MDTSIIQRASETLTIKARDTSSSLEAQQYAQAVLSLAHAVATFEAIRAARVAAAAKP